jgi:hypothetical protein
MFAFPLVVSKWWSMQNNFSLIYRKFDSDYDGVNISVDNRSYRVNMMNSFKLSKLLTAEISGFYQSGSVSGITRMKPMGRVDIGLQKKFRNENSRLNLNLTDAFKTNIMRNTSSLPENNIYSEWELDFEPRVLRLTFTHNFGKNTVKSARKRNTASEEERQRVGNN